MRHLTITVVDVEAMNWAAHFQAAFLMVIDQNICCPDNKLVRKLDSFAYNAGAPVEARDLMVFQQNHPR